MSVTSVALTALKNFQPTTSVVAGGAASVLVYALGSILVAAGVSIPFIGIPTMGMVAIASPLIGHIVTALVPDSVNQQLSGLATKLNVSVNDIKAVLPDVQYEYPGDVKPSGTVTNLKLNG